MINIGTFTIGICHVSGETPSRKEDIDRTTSLCISTSLVYHSFSLSLEYLLKKGILSAWYKQENTNKLLKN